MRKLLLLPFLFLLFIAGSCEDETLDPIDLSADQAYYPLELNQPLFYDQDSIVLFNTVSGIVYDTSRTEVRETLVEVFTEADGTETYRGERWQRPDATQPWIFVQTYTVSRSNSAVFRTEDNLQFTKMIFPIRENRSWDGNNAFDERREIAVGGEFLDIYNGWDYQYTNTDLAYVSPAGDSYPSSLVIQLAAMDTMLIDRRVGYEIYAPGVGLVERFLDARHTQCRICCRSGNDIDFTRCLDLDWDEKSEKGFILRQTIK